MEVCIIQSRACISSVLDLAKDLLIQPQDDFAGLDSRILAVTTKIMNITLQYDYITVDYGHTPTPDRSGKLHELDHQEDSFHKDDQC
jgi:hypothetical protein